MAISFVFQTIPVIDIVSKLYQLYEKNKQKEFFDNLTSLCAKGYRDGEELFDVLLSGFLVSFKDANKSKTKTQIFSDLSGTLLKKSLKFHSNLTYATFNWLIRKTSEIEMKRRGFILIDSLETYLGTLEVYEYQDGKIEKQFTFNENLRKKFCQRMNAYFRFILLDPVIDKFTNSTIFSNRFLKIYNEVMDATAQEFILFLYQDEPELLSSLGLDKPVVRKQTKKS